MFRQIFSHFHHGDPRSVPRAHGVLRHLSADAEVPELDDTLVVQQQIHGPWPSKIFAAAADNGNGLMNGPYQLINGPSSRLEYVNEINGKMAIN